MKTFSCVVLTYSKFNAISTSTSIEKYCVKRLDSIRESIICNNLEYYGNYSYFAPISEMHLGSFKVQHD